MVAALLLAACGNGPETFELRGQAMGTAWSVRVVAPPDGSGVDLEPLRERVVERLEDMENVFSTWRPDSEVSRFNAHAGEAWFAVSPVFLEVLVEAVRVSELTGGAFDPTVGPLVELWGFGAAGEAGWISPDEADMEASGETGSMAQGAAGPMSRGETGGVASREADVVASREAGGLPERAAGWPPPQEAVELLLHSTGFSHLQLRETPPAVRRARPGVRLDFSAIAKGYAVDEIWGLLSEAGLSDYLVEIGGEVRARGARADGQAWSIGIESPDGSGVTVAVPLRDAAIATSGDYRNYLEHEGERYSHVLDPRTGWPVSHGLTSVTVIASSASTADALATALLVLGPETGFQLAVDHGLAARLVVRTEEGLKVLPTPAYEAGFRR